MSNTQRTSTDNKVYVLARGFQHGTLAGYGYLEFVGATPERAMFEAQRQPWPEGAELGVASTIDVNSVTEWVPAR